MICDICSDDNPEYWAWSKKLEEFVPICQKCVDEVQPDKREKMDMNRITKAIIESLKNDKNLEYCRGCSNHKTCDSAEVYCAKYIEFATEEEA